MNNSVEAAPLPQSMQPEDCNDLPGKEPLGPLAAAVALQESGILVHAMTVTDLSSGYCVTGVNPDVKDPFLAGEGEPTFRGSLIGLKQLEMLRELVLDVLDHRKVHPEWAQMDTPIPRNDFPWGVGMPEPDVVVAGAHAEILADYLCCVGVRARKIDADRALWIAHDLEEARQKIARWEHDDQADESKPHWKSRWLRSPQGHVVHTSPLKLAAAIGAVMLFAIGGVSVISVLRDTDAQSVVAGDQGRGSVEEKNAGENAELITEPGQEPGDTEDRATEGARDRPAQPNQTATPEPPWREHHIQGQEMRPASMNRADVPVRMELQGWRRIGATADREEFMSADPGMRVLVSAKKTPLNSQEQLDAAVLKAIDNAEGVRVAGRSPVSYEEAYPESTTLWHVRLVEGHQVSIGCQFREVTGPRLEKCDQAADIAGPDLKTKR
ncbi:type VII secretion-associated protein [Corynebacterium anserum]|uniref:Type VII secretion-associated protein n=1 Tax=Corynebacterium anserum TaxID=2684406 RepID=A0A7G7YPY2_9CORY|nr:type VII secretion-associated protein [Corynebacterium anserum]QNH96552.1 type VII secretion-associated protein [Corynebacterium anserum]